MHDDDLSLDRLRALRDFVARGPKAIGYYQLKELGFDPWRRGPPTKQQRRDRLVAVLDALLVKAGYVSEERKDFFFGKQSFVHKALAEQAGEPGDSV
ncbi:MAG: hypothetical protein E6Q69_03130 [Aquipseudomonas alcaligenes]|uniref:Uncharacterized protein n=1 Tax=Aquipseudomonas alcaligenes TaxID=43263 RepID=A0A5C7WB69_AQUAC|nr:MAG: hypothetical protein E6Q69_03130 [Pseudomonas alcaligenes]